MTIATTQHVRRSMTNLPRDVIYQCRDCGNESKEKPSAYTPNVKCPTCGAITDPLDPKR